MTRPDLGELHTAIRGLHLGRSIETMGKKNNSMLRNIISMYRSAYFTSTKRVVPDLCKLVVCVSAPILVAVAIISASAYKEPFLTLS